MQAVKRRPDKSLPLQWRSSGNPFHHTVPALRSEPQNRFAGAAQQYVVWRKPPAGAARRPAQLLLMACLLLVRTLRTGRRDAATASMPAAFSWWILMSCRQASTSF